MTDPYARFRHLDGQVVGVFNVELLEDVDGQPLGMARTDEGPAILCLPALPDDDADR